MADGTRILVVEDDPDIRALLEAMMSAEGFDVRVAGSLQQCRTIMQQFDAALYLIDIGLPDGDGFSLVRDLRARGQVGVVVLSGRSAEVDQVLGLELGADDYVTKPFRSRELVARLRALERRVAVARGAGNGQDHENAPDFGVSGYNLYLRGRRLIDPIGNDVALTSAEFDVLVALMELKGKVASRDQIIESVRRRNWTGNERAIDGIVSRLRRKLPPQDSGAHFIRTVHGVGYMLTG